ncbi:MAG: hypothetical protein Q9160_001006 [Pyrenula sp. 1 TL-2023]
MTATFLQSELVNLIQESKKKFPDAAETSLGELKSLPATSEAQIAGDLIRRPQFIDPFVLGSRERLQDVLDAFKEVTSLGFDVQLKILQSLPSLLQMYGNEIHGQLIGITFEICSALQTAKQAVVSNTATATFQQLVSSVFDKVTEEDKQGIKDAVKEVSVFNDLSMLADGQTPKFFNLRNTSPNFILELLESLVINYDSVFIGHPELVQVIRSYMTDMIAKTFLEKQAFGQSVRAIRIFSNVLRRHIESMPDEVENVLELLNRSLEVDNDTPWRRAVTMELYRTLYSDFQLLRRIYAYFDNIDSRKNVISNSMGSFVRLASENPSLIGLSHQSTIPHAREPSKESEEQAAIDAMGITGVVSSTASAEASVTGISTEWSRMPVACIDQAERTTAPNIPDTYVYSLVIDCLSALSDGLARFIMPLSVPRESRSKRQHQSIENGPGEIVQRDLEVHKPDSNKLTRSPSGRKYQMLVNPLTIPNLPQLADVKMCVIWIESCWPAFLATSSTFLFAALDSDFYHSLIRSFQKLTQVSGILSLNTPRDALLTSLGKATIPIDSGSMMSPSPRQSSGWPPHDSASSKSNQLLSVLSPTLQSPTAESPRQSMDQPRSSLSTRNLLCLRALLNLGIALGPTLNEDAWSILLETLQQAEIVINVATQLASRRSSSITAEDDHILPKSNMGNELIAVQTATSRMLESTKDYPTTSFIDLLSALLRLTGMTMSQENGSAVDTRPSTSDTITLPKRGRMHQASRSISITLGRLRAQDAEILFVIDKCRLLCLANMHRFVSNPKVCDIWSKVVRLFLNIMRPGSSAELRLKATNSLDEMLVALAKAAAAGSASRHEKAFNDCLSAMKAQYTVALTDEHQSTSVNTTSTEIHDKALATLENFLESCGEQSAIGWPIVFDLIKSCFKDGVVVSDSDSTSNRDSSAAALLPRSLQLLRSAFRSLQMVGSDFLALLPAQSCANLVDALSLFGRQELDVNISLTVTTMYWDIANFVQGRVGSTLLSSDYVDHLDDVREHIDTPNAANEEQDGWMHMLWLRLMHSLTTLTSDARLEVRNGAFRVLFRIFEAHGQFLDPKAWRMCLELILLKALDEQTEKLQASTTNDETTPWEESLVALNEGLGRLLASFAVAIWNDGNSLDSWNKLYAIQARQLQQRPSVRLSSSIFGLIIEALEALKNRDAPDSRILSAPYNLLRNNYPSRPIDVDDAGEVVDGEFSRRANESNQQSAIAFIDAFIAIYTFIDPPPSFIDSSGALTAIREAIFTCSHAYRADLEKPSPEQAKALSILPKLYGAFRDEPADFMRYLFQFAEAFLVGVHVSSGQATFTIQKPSFMAFSRLSIDLIKGTIVQVSEAGDIIKDYAIVEALDILAKIMNFKHVDFAKESEPLIWQTATNAAVDIIEHVIPHANTVDRSILSAFYNAVNNVTKTILFTIQVPGLAPGNYIVRKPEDFDIKAFGRLHSAIVPAIGSLNVLDKSRRNYAATLFIASLVHHLKRHDLPSSPDELLENPLADLYQIRHPDVIEPRPTERPHIAYAALDALFDLITHHPKAQSNDSDHSTSDERRVSIARASAPYAVLRVALPLKSFIADQPVNATLPIPPSITSELTYITNRIVELESEDKAIPLGVEGGNLAVTAATGKRHLGHLYPIFVQFVEVLRCMPRDLEAERDMLWDSAEKWMRGGGGGEVRGIRGALK